MHSVPTMESLSGFNKNLGQLKVAIIHDELLEYGGSERVLEELLNIFPSADFYTLYFNKRDPTVYSTFNKAHPKTSFLQHIPGLYKLRQYFSVVKLVSWLYFYLLNLSKYDLVITSSHSFNSKIVRKARDAYHLCYLYSPPKYLYKETNEIAWIKRFPFNFLFFPLFALLRFTDKKASGHPDVIVAISQEVKKRVASYYGRDAIVINPPVRLPKKIKRRKGKGNYYLFLSRLVRQKGIELAVIAATKYRLPLVVVGDGHLNDRLEKMAGQTVTFLGRVEDSEMPRVYSKAKALIYCAIDEDFGLVPVEAMAYGVPVVAYKSGGVKETVIDGKTGVLFSDYSEKGLYKAIKRLEKLFIDPGRCSRQANKFSKEKFRKGILQLVESGLHEKFK